MPLVSTSSLTRDFLDSLTAENARRVIEAIGGVAGSRININARSINISCGIITGGAGVWKLRQYGYPLHTGAIETTHDSVNTTSIETGGSVPAGIIRINFPSGSYAVAGLVTPHNGFFNGSLPQILPAVAGLGLSSMDVQFVNIGTLQGRCYYSGSSWVTSGITPSAVTATWDSTSGSERVRLVHGDCFGNAIGGSDVACVTPYSWDSHWPVAVKTHIMRTDVHFLNRTTGERISTQDTKMDFVLTRVSSGSVSDVSSTSFYGTFFFLAVIANNTNEDEI